MSAAAPTGAATTRSPNGWTDWGYRVVGGDDERATRNITAGLTGYLADVKAKAFALLS